MTDPSRRDEWAQQHPGTYSYPAIPGESYQRETRYDPTQQLPAYSPYGYDPHGTAQYGSGGAPPEPPEPPRGRNARFWLWAAAGGALLLVVGMVIGLVIVNSSQQETVVAPPQAPIEPSVTRTPSTTTRTPTTTPTPTRSPAPVPPGTIPLPDETSPGAAHTVVYSVAGEGRAISILYLDTGGVLQTEFNVQLPWSKEVQLTGQADRSASVSIVNVGREITCSITIDGVDTQQNTGTGLTLCTAFGTR